MIITLWRLACPLQTFPKAETDPGISSHPVRISGKLLTKASHSGISPQPRPLETAPSKCQPVAMPRQAPILRVEELNIHPDGTSARATSTAKPSQGTSLCDSNQISKGKELPFRAVQGHMRTFKEWELTFSCAPLRNWLSWGPAAAWLFARLLTRLNPLSNRLRSVLFLAFFQLFSPPSLFFSWCSYRVAVLTF